MTILDRVRRNEDGKILIPMNVDGTHEEHKFFTTKKLVTLIVILICTILYFSTMSDLGLTILGWIKRIILWLIIVSIPVRYIIFEEKYYYKVYKKMKEVNGEDSDKRVDNTGGNNVTSSTRPTPALIWDIVSKQTIDGSDVLMYSDLKIGVMVKLYRDTIVGKGSDFKYDHYEAVSDFYKELNSKGYSYIICNIMTGAENDIRINELSKLAQKPKNNNLKKLLTLEVGYIKSLTRDTLFESDYILIYTKDINKIDNIVYDVNNAMDIMLSGGVIGYEILSKEEVDKLHGDQSGVKYFDSSEASLKVFSSNVISNEPTFTINSIETVDGYEYKVGERERILLSNLASGLSNGSVDAENYTIEETLYGKKGSKVSKDVKIGENLLKEIDNKNEEVRTEEELDVIHGFDLEESDKGNDDEEDNILDF